MIGTPRPWSIDWNSPDFIIGDGSKIVCKVLAFDETQRSADARLIAIAPDLAATLEAVVGWLEGTEAFETNHGAHSDVVWARKLLARAKGEA